MRPGIFARTFARSSLEETLDAVVLSGLRTVQLNLSIAGLPSLPERIEPELADRFRAALTARGLEAAAISGTYNMAHPDPAWRARRSGALEELIASSGRLGVRLITLCTGSRDPVDMWRWHPANATREAWRDMVGSVAAALEPAVRHGVGVAVEPEPNNVVDSAAAARRLLDELRSPALKVVLDAANLLRPAQLRLQRPTLQEALELLGEDVELVHAKDLRDDGSVVAAGKGRLDYDLYLGLLRRTGYRGPVILHGLREEDVPAAVAFLRDRLRQADAAG